LKPESSNHANSDNSTSHLSESLKGYEELATSVSDIHSENKKTEECTTETSKYILSQLPFDQEVLCSVS
jgi:hypothetical protein